MINETSKTTAIISMTGVYAVSGKIQKLEVIALFKVSLWLQIKMPNDNTDKTVSLTALIFLTCKKLLLLPQLLTI